jgi:hypothetical protein
VQVQGSLNHTFWCGMFTGKYRAIWKAWVCQSLHVERTCLFSVGVWLHPFSSMLHGASWMVLTGQITNQLSRSSQALYWTGIVYTVMYCCISPGCRCVPCIMQLAEMSCKISASLFNSWFLLSVEVSKGMGRVSSFQLYTVIIKLSLEQH